METSKVGERGTVVVPARLRRKFGIEEGTLVIAEEREDGILLRPAVALPLELYAPARRAEFLLSNAVDASGCEVAGGHRYFFDVVSVLPVLLNDRRR